MLEKDGLTLKRNKLEVGDRVWACAYDYNNNRLEKALIQTPVYGEIVKGKTGLEFRSFRKDGKLRSTGVNILSRTFSDSESDCIKIYNQKIQERIDVLRDEIDKLEKGKIK